MKAAIAFLFFLFFIACKKDGVSPGFRTRIVGSWEIERFTGFGTITYPPGNGGIIVLYSNGAFERRQHDTVLFRGNYSLKQKSDCYPREDNIFFSTNDNSYSMNSFISINDSAKLVLSSSNCLADGGTSIFRRQ